MSVIPIVDRGITVLRDILTTSPSLQIVAATDLKSTNVDSSPVIFAHASTNENVPGTKVITFEALRATETTGIVFTPTRIRGIKTSFSHIVPTTIYNIQSVTTSVIEPLDQNQLLSKLLLQLIGGQVPSDSLSLGSNPLGQNPLLGGAPLGHNEPATKFSTHTSTYVTTITNTESTVLGITLRGRLLCTTVIESSTEVVTATEFSTETIIRPTAAFGLGGGGGATGLPHDLQQQLLAAQLQQQLQQQQQQQLQQQLFNQQLLSQVNLDPALAAAFGGAPAAPQQIITTSPPSIEPSPPTPITSLVTKFVSGKRPGEFSIVVSTVIVEDGGGEEDDSRKKRSIGDNGHLRPSPVEKLEMTANPAAGLKGDMNDDAGLESSKDTLSRARLDDDDDDDFFELQSGMEDPSTGSVAGTVALQRNLHIPTQALLNARL
jgi:hypothetical protein